MKLVLLLVAILFAAQTNKAFEQLSAVKGLWKMETGKGAIFEEWSNLNQSSLTGRSYKVSQTDTTLFENILLQQVGNQIYYIPTVPNQNNGESVKFTLISLNHRTFVFENKQHDFPQRIVYRFVNNDSIVARIEGAENGKNKSAEYYYKRLK